jgi:Flp pilus assembly CpaF family ATPase
MNGLEVILPLLKPIEHLILDDSISEVMVNGPERVFIEKQGFLQQHGAHTNFRCSDTILADGNAISHEK